MSPAKVSSPPIRSPPSLSSLPQEILTLISQRLSRSDAISLSQTAHVFANPTEKAIWAELDLRIDPHFGEYPLIAPTEALGFYKYREWADKEQRLAEVRYRRELKDKMRRVVLRAGERRLGMVEAVKILPRPGNLYGLTYILDLLSLHLKSLQIERSPGHHPDEDYLPFSDTLDYTLITAGLSFPSLTHIMLRGHTAQYTGLMAILVIAAPNLISFDMGFHDCRPAAHLLPPFPTIQSETKLEQLSLPFNTVDRDNDDDAETTMAIAEPLLTLLKKSPKLCQLRVLYFGWLNEIHDRVAEILSGHTSLRDLYWSADADALSAVCEESGPIPCVRRLAAYPYYWSAVVSAPEFVLHAPVCIRLTSEFRPPTGMPNLESLYIVCSNSLVEKLPTPGPAPASAPAQPMVPCFADGIRANPHLRIIHTLGVESRDGDFDVFARMEEVEEAGRPQGRIRSYRHDEHELLHATMLLAYKEVSDEVCREDSPYEGWIGPVFRYDARDGSKRKKIYEMQSEITCYNYTDFDGTVVPLEVLEDMRKAEGMSEAEWDARGVQAGDEAWKVLTDWREAQLGQSDGA